MFAASPLERRRGARRAPSPSFLGPAVSLVHRYLKAHDLPYHPLFEQGFATVGDWHSSRAVQAGDTDERDTRFRGMKQECGLHLDEDQAASLDASGL